MRMTDGLTQIDERKKNQTIDIRIEQLPHQLNNTRANIKYIVEKPRLMITVGQNHKKNPGFQ